jgi:phenylalanine-4-hydroxylase
MTSRARPSESLYSPVRTRGDGTISVELGATHPGFADRTYRARRDEIASLAVGYERGGPVPTVEYTETEHEVWRIVSAELSTKHRRYATRAFLEAEEQLGLPRDRIPQLTEVTDRLAPCTGFEYEPIAGLAPLREFYSSFADDVFFSTQYIRHASSPLYTPEPDIVHEVIGHANQLADPNVARLYRLFSAAVRRVETDAALRVLSRVFWYTFEFGLVVEDGALKTYGAGILSSFGELDAYCEADIRPLDFTEMTRVDYDITKYQAILFAARSMTEVFDALERLLADFSDETAARMTSDPLGTRDVSRS